MQGCIEMTELMNEPWAIIVDRLINHHVKEMDTCLYRYERKALLRYQGKKQIELCEHNMFEHNIRKTSQD